jgi:hypothetical protein
VRLASDAVGGDGFWIPGNYAREIPELEAFEKVLALRKERVGPGDRLVIREVGKFLDGHNMPAAREIAPHHHNSHRKTREFAFP